MGHNQRLNFRIVFWTSVTLLFTLLQIKEIIGNCAAPGAGGGIPTRFRACPYDPPGLEVTRGLAGHCNIGGDDLVGDCVTDEDCYLKKLGNICCYSRCLGITQCHRFP